LDHLDARETTLATAIAGGEAFMTNGCPDRSGKMACNRPYGSYRPGEPFRDYPFPPTPEDVAVICEQMRLQEIRPSPQAG
jgi:biotin synthase